MPWFKGAAVAGIGTGLFWGSDNAPRPARAVGYALAAVVGLVLFYAIRLDGFSHCIESGSRWRIETFGGRHHVDRSVRTPDRRLARPAAPSPKRSLMASSTLSMRAWRPSCSIRQRGRG